MKCVGVWRYLSGFLLFAGSALCDAQPLIIPATQSTITVDGSIDDPGWQDARVIQLNYVTRPFENTAPPVATEVRVVENGEMLFVRFIADDPNPDAISAFYRDRDGIWNDDMVGIKLDTFNDSRLAYQFFINPLGIQADSIENEMTGSESDSWDAIWQSAGQITEQGFVVEVAIPLRILNFKEGEEHKVWGAEFVRFYPRNERLRISNTPHDRNNACTLCQLSEVSGFKGASQSQNLALIPTLVLGRGRSRDPYESLDWQDDTVFEPGLDLKWAITPEVSLQGTLNPDFSQVEADVAQLSINNTFALYFDEKRPFFLDNADYFDTNQTLIYTRNIASPNYGAKATGRMGDHTLGVFVADDESTTFLVPGNLGSDIAVLEESSTNLGLRYRYDVNDDVSLGAAFTARESDNYHNYVAGFDTKVQLTDQDVLRVQWVGSNTQYPLGLYQDFCTDGGCDSSDQWSEAALRLDHEDDFNGQSYRVNYRHEERNWHFRAAHYHQDQDYRADLGFVSGVDRNQTVIGGGYVWLSDDNWWNAIEVFGDWDVTYNDAGDMLEKETEVYLSMSGKWQSYMEVGLLQRERSGLRHDPSITQVKGNTQWFAEQMASTYIEFRPVAEVQASVYARLGDQIDFENDRLGEQVYINPEISWSIGRHLQLDVRHTYSALDADGQDVFTANLTDARMTYQFDQRQFLRLVLVYADIERNPDNYLEPVDRRYRSLGTQLLYSYKVNPLTKFFVGYADSAFQDDQITAMTNTDKSVFMKISYAWLQ